MHFILEIGFIYLNHHCHVTIKESSQKCLKNKCHKGFIVYILYINTVQLIFVNKNLLTKNCCPGTCRRIIIMYLYNN